MLSNRRRRSKECDEIRKSRLAKSFVVVRRQRSTETEDQRRSRLAQSLLAVRRRRTVESIEERLVRRLKCLIAVHCRRLACERLFTLARNRLQRMLAERNREQQRCDVAGITFRTIVAGGFESPCLCCHRLFHKSAVLKFQVQ